MSSMSDDNVVDKSCATDTAPELRWSLSSWLALVLGLAGLIFPPAGLVAVLVGWFAINRIDDVVNRLRGRALAQVATDFGLRLEWRDNDFFVRQRDPELRC